MIKGANDFPSNLPFESRKMIGVGLLLLSALGFTINILAANMAFADGIDLHTSNADFYHYPGHVTAGRAIVHTAVYRGRVRAFRYRLDNGGQAGEKTLITCPVAAAGGFPPIYPERIAVYRQISAELNKKLKSI